MNIKNTTQQLLGFVFIVFCMTNFSYAQTNFSRFYIKLSPKLNFNTANEALQRSNIKQLQNTYNFSFNDAYSINRSKIQALKKASKTGFTLKNTFVIEGDFNDTSANLLLEDLKSLPNIVYAYKANTTPIQPPNDIAPVTTNFEPQQGYLETNPGLNIRHAWNNNINGANINIKAVEYGLNIAHEELEHKNATIFNSVTINSQASNAYTEHGTAVGSIVYADKGTYGISGIAHNANGYTLFPEWTEENGYNRVLAVSQAINNSTAGDVIIFEMQTSAQNGNFVTAEFDQAIWDLTKAATDAGIVIVAAAGNGNENLDDPYYNTYNARGDSGAIMVGAGSSTVGHNPMSFSTYGNRVNLHAWGENVYSAAFYNYSTVQFGNDFNQSYFTAFAGTSSATAIIGGFTAVLQSYNLAQSGGFLTSVQLRDIMVATGIPQGSGKHIGPMPYMSAAMAEVDLLLSTDHFTNNTFSLAPNPSNGNVAIHFSERPSTEINVNVFSILGQKVFESKLTDQRNLLNLSHLSKGVYLVVLSNSNFKTTKKLIIN